jgi:hypothetical protein
LLIASNYRVHAALSDLVIIMEESSAGMAFARRKPLPDGSAEDVGITC